MEIKDLRFTRFHAAEHVQFGAEFIHLTEPVREELPQWDGFVALHGEEERIFKKLVGYALTSEVDRCDETRDIHIYGLFMMVKAMQHHYSPETVAVAGVVAQALKPYKGVCKITYNQETATVTRMVTELQKGDTAQAVEQLGLTEWVAKIDEDNRRFNDLVMQRNAAVLEKTEGNMRDIRSRVDPVYYDTVKRINALAIISGDNRYDEMIRRINDRIDVYMRTVAQRHVHVVKPT